MKLYRKKRCFERLASKFIAVFILVQVISGIDISLSFAAEPDSIINKANKKFSKNKLYYKKLNAEPKVPGTTQFVISGDNTPLIKLRSIKLTDATVFSHSDLSASYQKYIGRTVSERDIAQITSNLTKYYHDAGYVLSRAFVPPQDVDGGALVIQIVEGYVQKVILETDGDNNFGADRFTSPITKERPLKISTLERQLMLISDISGVSIKDTSLDEATEMSGQYILTIHLDTWQLWSYGEIDNRGSDDVGPYQAFRSIYLNSLFGKGSSIGINYSSIADSFSEFSYGQLSLDIPLDERGTKLYAYISGGDTRPSGEQGLIDVHYETLQAVINLQTNLIRRRDMSLSVSGGIWLSERSEENTFGLVSEDKLHGVDFFTRMFHRSANGHTTYLFANLRQGIDIGDSSRKGDPFLSRFDGDGKFTKFNLDISRNQIIYEQWSLQFNGAMQLATEGLLSNQEFYIGGSRYGRAYESGELNGDSAVAASLELQYFHNVDNKYLNSVQFYGFADIGTIIDDGSSSLNGATLSSAGFGARFNLPYNFDAQIEFAFPLEDSFLNGQNDAHEVSFKIGHSIKLNNFNFSRN